jgi:hypothetical protein
VSVRQREHDGVVTREDVGSGGLEHPVGEWGEVRVHVRQGLPGASRRRDGTDLELRVRQEQPEDLATGVPARSRDRDSIRHAA